VALLDPSHPVHSAGRPLHVAVLDFWRWSGSDLLSNAQRGVLAEYLVGLALSCITGVRTEWDPWDLVVGGVKVEVKSSAFVQSWDQRKPSKARFDIKRTRIYDPKAASWVGEPRRHADIYVFALLSHRLKETIDPLDVSQWEFFVVPTAALDRDLGNAKTVGLAVLKRLAPTSVTWHALGDVVVSLTPTEPASRNENVQVEVDDVDV